LAKIKTNTKTIDMNAKELRIGNYINNEQRTEVIDGIDLYRVQCHLLSDKTRETLYEVPLKLIKPIPLTEEWLLKFGFLSNPYKDRYEKGDIDIECNKTRGKTELWLSGFPYIKHIHQLQNLYFALTNEELKQ
jgi:hypothetical protein